MAYYNVCPNCGCNLDPGEKCDCRDKKSSKKYEEYFEDHLKIPKGTGQIAFSWDSERCNLREK